MDKAPSLGIPFFFRVVVPGAVVSGVLTPLTLKALDGFGLTSEHQTVVIAALLVFTGLVLWALDDPIYGLLEGRWSWPVWLKQRRVDYWREKARTLYARAEASEGAERAELWYALRQFPRDAQGIPTATAPTRLGNILASYEEYPDARYGMDSVFFWPRIWLQLDKDTRSEVDESWAIADTFTYLVVGLLMAALAYLAVAIWAALPVALPPWARSPFGSDDVARHIVAGAGLLLAARIAYLISLPLHVRNGGVYKALFDLFHGKVADLAPGTDDEKLRFTEIYNALEYDLAFAHKPKPAPLSIPPDAEFGVVFKKP